LKSALSGQVMLIELFCLIDDKGSGYVCGVFGREFYQGIVVKPRIGVVSGLLFQVVGDGLQHRGEYGFGFEFGLDSFPDGVNRKNDAAGCFVNESRF